MDRVDAALLYAELGYRIFPVLPGGKFPAITGWPEQATANEDIIRQWWFENPEYNIGLLTTGLLVIDIDRHQGQENPWPHTPERSMELAVSPMAVTPRGGRHHIFRQPEPGGYRCSTSKVAPNVDVRADRGFIVVAPSNTEAGEYQWINDGLDVSPRELPLPPKWLTETLNGHGAASVQIGGENVIGEGQRNDTLSRLAGSMRRNGMSRDEIEGALLVVNENRCTPPLPDAEVMRICQSISRYEPSQIAVAMVEGHYDSDRETNTDPVIIPPPAPEDLLYIPGFVGEMIDYCLEVAPYPNRALAFCGALAMQSFVAGRKVRDEADVRPNLYILGLANSGAGKNSPRSLNQAIAVSAGFIHSLGNQFGSGEGVEDAMSDKKAMLVQTDEMDKMLQAISKSKEARYESLMATLLSMYSDSSSQYICRILAGGKGGGAISQPHLTIFGTAIPDHYYGALSEAMLSNGFFSRMIVVESAGRPDGQTPKPIDPPESILNVARGWMAQIPGGNLGNENPRPRTVPATPEARSMLEAAQRDADSRYRDAEAARDSLRMSIYNRQNENTRKLALLYALSVCPETPEVRPECVEWASAFMGYQVERMIHQARSHVADNPFHEQMLKVRRILEGSPGNTMKHSELLRRMKMKKSEFTGLIESMAEAGDILPQREDTTGRPRMMYTLCG
jgi:hypothetical protein